MRCSFLTRYLVVYTREEEKAAFLNSSIIASEGKLFRGEVCSPLSPNHQEYIYEASDVLFVKYIPGLSRLLGMRLNQVLVFESVLRQMVKIGDYIGEDRMVSTSRYTGNCLRSWSVPRLLKIDLDSNCPQVSIGGAREYDNLLEELLNYKHKR